MRATAGTMMLMMVLASAGASFAFCEAICAPAEAPSHHAQQLAAHPHAHAAQSSAPISTVEKGSGCKTLAQVSLMRRRSTLSPQSQSASAPAPDGLSHFREAAADFGATSRWKNRSGPPLKLPAAAPLRI